jgi:alpha-beta hydrolase superfamily lysophospholipase
MLKNIGIRRQMHLFSRFRRNRTTGGPATPFPDLTTTRMGRSMERPDRIALTRPAAHRLARVLAALSLLAAPVLAQGPVPQGRPAAAAQPRPATAPAATPPERLRLTTSDGVQLAASYYAVADQAPTAAAGGAVGGRPRPPVVILLHDLDGSHGSVDPLARGLQQRGVAVVALSLRGHGTETAGSLSRTSPDGKTTPLSAAALRKPDFDAMIRTSGGRVRDQALVRGDIETVRNWIKRQADAGVLDLDRLYLVGSGVGAALAMAWAIEDAGWPPLATGPQGGHVRGIAMISPAWTTRGFSVAPALAAELIRRRMPLMVIAGHEDRDAIKLYDQLKRQRPQEWYERRAGQKPESAVAKDASPTLYLFQLSTPEQGDKLAALERSTPEGSPADLIAGFITSIEDAAAADR